MYQGVDSIMLRACLEGVRKIHPGLKCRRLIQQPRNRCVPSVPCTMQRVRGLEFQSLLQTQSKSTSLRYFIFMRLTQGDLECRVPLALPCSPSESSTPTMDHTAGKRELGRKEQKQREPGLLTHRPSLQLWAARQQTPRCERKLSLDLGRDVLCI